MPESASLRGRRFRAHRRGDHSSCKSDCTDARVRAAEPDRPIRREPGDLRRVIEAFAAATDYQPSDPRSISLAVAVRLADALDLDPTNSAVAREISNIVGWLAADPAAAAGGIDEIRAKRASRQLHMLLGEQ